MKSAAFSLVELSIVLVILGLLTGGILAGQSLIRAAELRAVTAEYQRYMSAMNTFRDKYFANAGDFTKATQFWGRASTGTDCVSNSGIASATSPGACDGDGDGLIEQPGAASQAGEQFQFWKQLALAGLIEGNYSGVAGSAGFIHSVAGTNVPPSKLNSGIWAVYWRGTTTGDALVFNTPANNQMIFGAATPASVPETALLKPEEAWNIDTKLDDGKPGTGNITVRYWNNACATGAASGADTGIATYNLSNSSAQCVLYFMRIF